MKIIPLKHGQKVTEQGVYQMPAAWYHDDCCDGPSFSATMATELYRSCAKTMWFKSYLNPDRPETDNKRFDLGRAAHAAVLEENWQDHVVVVGKKESRARKAYLKSEAKLANVVSMDESQMARVLAARDALWADDECHKLTTEGQNELSYFAKDEDTGIWLKVRPDTRIRLDANVCVRDYKTTDGSVHPRALARKIHDEGSFIQAAAQLDVMTRVEGARPHDFAWIFQESSPPHLINIARPSEIVLDWGRIVWLAKIREFFQCLTADHWPEYERNQEIDLPRGMEMHLEERRERGDFGDRERVGEDDAKRVFGYGNNPETLKAY